MVNQYFMSKRLFKPEDPKFVNVTQDRLFLDTLLNGKESGRAEFLENKFMNANEAINRIINCTKAWYKISNGDREPIIRSVPGFFIYLRTPVTHNREGRVNRTQFRSTSLVVATTRSRAYPVLRSSVSTWSVFRKD